MINAAQSETIEFGHALRTIAGRWRVVAGAVLLGVAIAAAVVAFAPRRYTAVGTLMLKSSSGGGSILSQVAGLNDATGGLLGVKTQAETEIAVLQSRALMGEVVDSLWMQARMKSRHAQASRQIFSSFNAPGSFPFHSYDVRRNGTSYSVSSDSESYTVTPGVPAQVGPARLTIATNAHLPASFTLEIRDRDDAIDWAIARLGVDKGKGDVVRIGYSADDSVSAAAVPNLLVDRYLERRRVTDKGVNQRRVEFLTAKNDSMTRSLTDALRALRQQQESSGVLSAEASGKIGLESLAGLREQLAGVLVEQGTLRQLLGEIASKSLNPRNLAVYPSFLKSPAVNQLVVELTSTESRRTALLATRTPNDPEVIALARTTEDIEHQLIPYATTYGEALDKQRADLENSVKRIEGELSGLPRAAERAGQLQFNVEDLAKMSGGLQAALVEAKLAAIGEGGDVHPLDPAVVPKTRSFPKPVPLLAAGMASGLMVGAVLALMLGALGRWVRDPVELERSTGVPTIRFDPASPLLLASGATRTIVVAPVAAGLATSGIVTRLAQTATWRSVSAAVLTLPEQAADVNAQIAKLESEHDLVIVELPSLTADTAVATLQQGRPVLLVTSGPRTDRHRVVSAIEMLRRLEVPCAGVVIDSPKERPLIHIGRA